ncbi:hypothetical protein [Brevundimonas sp.]|uniref:hypothetical protein n=1 Tax=Brevundimonas sp. TaxID=1871086 RepID=UPI00286A97D6|nr:hypothetical protein [Brevundimonas sp.]
MQRIVIVGVLSGLLAACGQQAPAVGEAGTPAAELDFIEAVPIVEEEPAPVVQPQPAPKKEEAAKAPEPEEKLSAETTRTAPEPAAAIDAATSATQRANEAAAAGEPAPPTPYQPTPN